MGKIPDHSTAVRQKCVDLHKSWNEYKKIAARLKMPIWTVRATIKKFKKFKAIIKQPGRGCKVIWSANTVKRMVREVQNLQRPPFQSLVASWGHRVSKSTMRRHLHANKLSGRNARKKPFFSFHHRQKRLDWKFNWDRVL